ncbi:MAG: tyrosine-protein phosphatase [Bacteroidales bacterium]|nr:tyrosine-protein phosphatase [Bacteroidales bacterium]
MNFEAIVNARDLGGLPAADGRTVRKGMLLRTGHLHDATDADVRLLVEKYHLCRIFDFRTEQEIQAQADRPVPGAQHISLPTLDTEKERESGEAVPEGIFLDLPRYIVQLSFNKFFQQKGRDLYPSLVQSEFSQLQYAAFLNLIMEAPEGAVLWHCSQGKDRTGIGAAFILSALGADRDTIVADFDRSNLTYKPLVDELLQKVTQAGGQEAELDTIRAFMGVNTKNFCRTLDLIDREWGSMDRYLTQQLGLTDDDRALLRKRFLEG